MPEVERSYMRKVGRRIVPLLFLGVLLGYLDRSNIAYAAPRLSADLRLTPLQYGWAASLFFVGYFCFEVPGTVALQRWGARAWMSFLIVCWGVLSLLTAIVTDRTAFYLLRFLLGVSEAGFFPGSILYLATWVPHHLRARYGARFMTAVPMAMVVGGPATGLLLKLDGWHGLHGWQWMFIGNGVPCFALAAVFAALLTDRPERARWLSDAERRYILQDRAEEDRARSRASGRADWRQLVDARMLLLCFVSFGGPAVAIGVTFWLPQVMLDAGLSPLRTGLLSALPFAVSAVSMWCWGAHSDRAGERTWHLALPLLVSAGGLAGAALLGPPLARFAMLVVASLGMFSFLPVSWGMSHALLRGAAAPVGYGLVSMSGALAGVVGPSLVGLLRQLTGTHQAGIFGLVGIAALASVAALCLGALTDRRGRAGTA